MASCRTCGVDLGKDGRRKYCDKHRELRSDGQYRRKGWIKDYFRNYKPKCERMTRKVGTGFSEHMRTDRKTGAPLFQQERIAVRKEKKRVLNPKRVNNFPIKKHRLTEHSYSEEDTVCLY